ncbi:YqgE/AlgH family protein [uncultured Lentibacter sp.]|jgi:putative transcriptional regulator|uniref:YqgE/AlgH family protein n=1 Tax=uncultured Lentibacter sp. TaxID=1659309 RepID=UPI002601BFFF|nr:YqgE/AlgH family protein [uncultured Lentibacter sp.]
MSDLTGQLLIAMPAIGDPRFERAVILICEHSPDGTMGLVLNKPSREVSFAALCEQLSLGPPEASRPVHFGGPVEMGRGFVLHSGEYVSGQSSHLVLEGVRLSASLDVLEDMVTGTGPREALVCLGYAGWGAGQLEQELRANGWLTAPADAAFVFAGGGAEKWSAALKTLGVDPLLLSATAGHA